MEAYWNRSAYQCAMRDITKHINETYTKNQIIEMHPAIYPYSCYADVWICTAGTISNYFAKECRQLNRELGLHIINKIGNQNFFAKKKPPLK